MQIKNKKGGAGACEVIKKRSGVREERGKARIGKARHEKMGGCECQRIQKD